MKEWPKHDPMTGRDLCESCWNGVHWKKNWHDDTISACTGECDCGHINSEQVQAIERRTAKENRKAKRDLEKAALENSPLQAVNPKFDRVPRGRVHA